MGAEEPNSTAKQSKPNLPQETHPPSYADWSNSMQAYYGPGATPFFGASPTPHPYMWGGQHPMMPPYGTPVPYPAMYSPAGVYAHPGMPTTPSTTPPNTEMEAKAPNGKGRGQNKKSKGNLGNANIVGIRSGESSGNDGTTQSAESGNNGSSDASDENKHGYSGNSVVPTKNTLNMGMESWNPSSGASQPVIPPPIMESYKDERELKRQKRKQSNRESARRSRLRKQAECEELQAKVQALTNENHTLRDELKRVSEECKKLTSENDSIKEKLLKIDAPLQS